MGNCLLRHQSSMQWAGDDWGAVAGDLRSEEGSEEEGLLLGGGDKKKIGFLKPSSSSSSSASASSTEIKIKITKKQLEELLGKTDVKDLSVKQVLAHLMMNVNRYYYHDEKHQRSWRPALQSIPELN